MRVGFFDLFAAVALVLVLVLPAPGRQARSLYFKEQRALATRIAEAQAAVARDPKDGVAAARLADLLVEAHQSDWAIRVAALGAEARAPASWRAAMAASAAYMDRKDIAPASEWAARSLALCDSGDCTDDDRVRLQMVATALRSVLDSGVEVKKSAKGVSDAVERAVPLIRLGGKKP